MSSSWTNCKYSHFPELSRVDTHRNVLHIYCDKREFTHQNTGTNIFLIKNNDQLICHTGICHLNFLCILSWIDVINCISNFRDYCYVIIMYSSVFNQVRRHKVLYFSSYTFLCIDTFLLLLCVKNPMMHHSFNLPSGKIRMST